MSVHMLDNRRPTGIVTKVDDGESRLVAQWPVICKADILDEDELFERRDDITYRPEVVTCADCRARLYEAIDEKEVTRG